MFSQTCIKNSAHGEGVGVGVHQTPPWTDTSQADIPQADTPRQTSPRADTTPPTHETATAADSTHPTGMHSCYFYCQVFSCLYTFISLVSELEFHFISRWSRPPAVVENQQMTTLVADLGEGVRTCTHPFVHFFFIFM